MAIHWWPVCLSRHDDTRRPRQRRVNDQRTLAESGQPLPDSRWVFPRVHEPRALLGRVDSLDRSIPDESWLDTYLAREMPEDWLEDLVPETFSARTSSQPAAFRSRTCASRPAICSAVEVRA